MDQSLAKRPMIELFRSEVLARRGQRLHGEIALATPLSWQVLTYSLVVVLVAAAVFVSVGTYTRVEIAPGVIAPEAGIAAVAATRSGVITEVFVREGAAVKRGTPLARVRVAETLMSGQVSSDRQTAAIGAQARELETQSSALGDVFVEEAAGLERQVEGLDEELIELERQIGLQRQLVASSQEILERTREIAEGGFISRQTLQTREDTYLLRQQQLAQLEQTRSAKRTARAEASRSIARLRAQRVADAAGGRLRIKELDRARLEAAASDGYLIVSPIDGIATAVSARVGQAVDSSSPVVTIVPAARVLRAEISVPASAIGFVTRGQEVRLGIDGFPVQRYGSIRARVVAVPIAPIARKDSQGQLAATYPVVCEITDLAAVHRADRPLIAGMTLSARITTRRQSLLRWLFEPLLEAGRR